MTLMSLMLQITVLLASNLFLFFKDYIFLMLLQVHTDDITVDSNTNQKLISRTVFLHLHIAHSFAKRCWKIGPLFVRGGWITSHHQASIISLKTLQLNRGHVTHQANGQPSQLTQRRFWSVFCTVVICWPRPGQSVELRVSWWLQWDIF